MLWTHLSGRSVTYVVASVDASALERAQANFICSGVHDELQIQAAINAIHSLGLAGKVKLVGRNFYLVPQAGIVHPDGGLSCLRLYSDICLSGQGKGQTKLNVPVCNGVNSCIATWGSLGFDATPTAGISIRDTGTTLTAGQGANFASDDLVLISSTDLWRNIVGCTQTELQKLVSVVGDVLTFRGSSRSTYQLASTARVRKVNTVKNAEVRDLSLIGPNDGVNGYGCIFYYSENPRLSNVEVSGFSDRAVVFESQTYNPEIHRCTIRNANKVGLGYGIVAGNVTEKLLVSECYFSGCRHACDVGGNNPSRDMKYVNCIVDGQDPATGLAIFNLHNCVEGVIHSGHTIEARNNYVFAVTHKTVISNCTIRHAGAVILKTKPAGDITFENNIVEEANYFATNFEYAAWVDNPVNLILKGNIFIDGGGASACPGFILDGNMDTVLFVDNIMSWTRNNQPLIYYAPSHGHCALTLRGNRIKTAGVASGVLLVQTAGVAFSKINVEGNILDGVTGKFIDLFADNGNISDVVVSGNNGVDPGDAIVYSRVTGANTVQYVKVSGNSMRKTGGALANGIQSTGNSDHWTVDNNTLINITSPVVLAGSNNMLGKTFTGSVSPVLKTISGGVITLDQWATQYSIDTEGGGVTDDLDTITAMQSGVIIILKANNSARDVVVKHGTGNLFLNGGADFTMDHEYDKITLISDGVNLLELSRSTNS